MPLRWPLLTIPYTILVVIVAIALYAPLYLVFLLLTLPYTIFYRSSNWSMREKDMPAVQRYFDLFQALYPDLVTSVAAAHIHLQYHNLPETIDFWPAERNQEFYCIPCVGSVTIKNYRFSLMTALFSRLEEAGWSRQVLLEFLRDKVEGSGLAQEEEKAAFAKVMYKMCAHDLLRWPDPIIRVLVSRTTDWTQQGLKAWDGDVPLGMPIVHVSLDSVDWLLVRGAFLVPTDHYTLSKMSRLARYPMWAKVKTVEDLERGVTGFWQAMAQR